MRVHVNVEAIALGNSQHFNGVLYPFLVIDARALSFNGLPSKDVSDAIVAIPPQSRKVNMGVVLSEGPLQKADVISVKEAVFDLRGLIEGLTGVFGVACDVDATENDLPADAVHELAIFNLKTERGHGVGSLIGSAGRVYLWTGG